MRGRNWFGGRVVLAVAAISLICTSGADAKSCPNATTTTVTGKPSYTYTRGCIVSFDQTAIVYNLFEPLNPKPASLYTILEGPGWGGAGSMSPDSNLISAGYAQLTWIRAASASPAELPRSTHRRPRAVTSRR